jgi:hypothetical protein
MSTSPVFHFGPFALDLLNACLWQGAQSLTLWPKDFAVLHYLVTHAERLVTKEELFAAIWPETFVSDGGLERVYPTDSTGAGRRSPGAAVYQDGASTRISLYCQPHRGQSTRDSA